MGTDNRVRDHRRDRGQPGAGIPLPAHHPVRALTRTAPVPLRAAGPDDADAVAAVYAPYVTGTAVTFEEVPPTGAQVRARMTGAPRLPWWVAVDTRQVVGFAYAAPHRARPAYRWSVEVSVYLAPSHTGRGIGTGLYRRLLPELRRLGYVGAYAGIALPNPASITLHERLGFVPLGVFESVGHKHGRWHDVGWWRLALADPPASPAEPRPWVPPRQLPRC